MDDRTANKSLANDHGHEHHGHDDHHDRVHGHDDGRAAPARTARGEDPQKPFKDPALAMSLSSVSVITNTLRLRWFVRAAMKTV